MQKELHKALKRLSEEAMDVYLPSEIPVLDYIPTPIVFLRKYVAANRPVIFKNCLKDWPACSKWTDEYLEQALWDTEVTVTATPNGYADSPVGDKFVLPQERQMLFQDLMKIWKNKDKNSGVYYIQKQNSNFTDEFVKLMSDADSHIDWATEAFGMKPEAVNFWMGNSDSITSMHKDHYENMYGVVRGSKTFILHPPTDVHLIPYRTYQTAQFKQNLETNKFDIVDVFEEPEAEDEQEEEQDKEDFIDDLMNTKDQSDDASRENVDSENEEKGCDSPEKIMKYSSSRNKKTPVHKTVSWIAVDPLCPDLDEYPQYENCHKYEVVVEAGDVLYLPSLWFHHVRQSDSTIAVNFWYDMEYGIKYNYFKFAEQVSSIVSSQMWSCD